MTPSQDREQWLSKKPNENLSKKLKIATWIITSLVLILVVLMRGPYKIPLPDGWSMSFLPPVHAILNTLVALSLVGALLAVKVGKISLHRLFIFTAMILSALFLLCYVAYHFTTVETKYGGDGWLRVVYFILLISHIILAAVSLPMILLVFTSGFTNHFQSHRKLARWVFPIWLYVAVTGPICYLMLRSYYP
ncbi:MAG: DUF420 domain-containing protein [Akkermansiaceae bacterium]|jgi:putative membrane protein